MFLMNALLLLALLCMGLFAGLMMTLTVILQRQWDTLTQEEYVHSFKTFLLIAKGHPLISLLTLAACMLPMISGIVQLGDGNTDQGVIVLAAGILFSTGCLGVTIRLNFPIYAQVVGWKHAALATDWEAVRKRFYRLNVIRLAAAVGSFILLGSAALMR